MNLTIKILPPYAKKGEPDQYIIQLEEHTVDLQQLALHLSREWKDKLNYVLIDDHNRLTAEFIVNGSHASLDLPLKEGDHVTIVPYICGG
ncbi:MAG: MoaD/ThiS family protein [Bacillota bacterium]